MSTCTYKVRLTDGSSFLMRADFAQASSPIRANWDPDEDESSWNATPYQVADARHCPRVAAELCINYTEPALAREGVDIVKSVKEVPSDQDLVKAAVHRVNPSFSLPEQVVSPFTLPVDAAYGEAIDDLNRHLPATWSATWADQSADPVGEAYEYVEVRYIGAHD